MTKECAWCKELINSYQDHQNFMGSYTCERAEQLGNKSIILYHQTSTTIADIILKTGIMKPGNCGIAGPAIYFATSPENTNHKARFQGAILECLVDVGNVKKTGPEGDPYMNKSILSSQGYNSIYIPRVRGEEYAIYDTNRIKRIQLYRSIL